MRLISIWLPAITMMFGLWFTSHYGIAHLDSNGAAIGALALLIAALGSTSLSAVEKRVVDNRGKLPHGH